MPPCQYTPTIMVRTHPSLTLFTPTSLTKTTCLCLLKFHTLALAILGIFPPFIEFFAVVVWKEVDELVW